MRIRVFLSAEREGGFSVVCPELPGCQSAGESKDEALKNIREAIELYLAPTPGVGVEVGGEEHVVDL